MNAQFNFKDDLDVLAARINAHIEALAKHLMKDGYIKLYPTARKQAEEFFRVLLLKENMKGFGK
jgi:hypothetical protein